MRLGFITVLFFWLFTACSNQPNFDEVWEETPSKFLNLKSGKLHYKKLGNGDPIIFLHGNFTHSYLWRNVIPGLSEYGTCYALDLMGMGGSDKPYIQYTILEQARYLDSFITKLNLNNIRFVGIEWGATLALNYASRAQHKVTGFALMEPIISGIDSLSLSQLPHPIAKAYYKLKYSSNLPYKMLNENVLMKEFLPMAVVKPMSDEVMNRYLEPYPDAIDRRPIMSLFQAFPVNGKPSSSQNFIALFKGNFEKQDVPKLLIHSNNGLYIQPKGLQYLQHVVLNMELVNAGDAGLLIPEDQPEAVLDALQNWLKNNEGSFVANK